MTPPALQRNALAGLACLLALAGCIGTDLVDEMSLTPGEARIVLSPSEQAALVGETATFEATYYGEDGQADAGAVFAWHTSDASVASVDGAGTATAHMPGQVQVWAEAGEVTSPSAQLTVLADPDQVARVEVAPDSAAIAPGTTRAFAATAYDLGGDVLSGVEITWAVADTAIAEIDGQGSALGKVGGVTHVTATAGEVTSLPAALRVFGQQRAGRFEARPGTSYDVEGAAVLEEGADGTLMLRFEDDFDVSPGPGLEVILSTSNAVTAQSVSLGDIKATAGAQTYGVPTNIDIDTYSWVIIHCVPFNVTFGYAQLQ